MNAKVSAYDRMPMVLLSAVFWCGIFFVALGMAQGAGIADIAISDAVEDALQRDQAVSTHWIDISVSGGVVSLSGQVNNILAKERATRIAETIKGVLAVVNSIEVAPSPLRTDSGIQDDVKNALMMDRATDAYELNVTVKDNVVTLSGTVESWQERALSEKVAMGVSGVKDVENDIAVQYLKERPDSEILHDIEQALRWDVLVDHAAIDVAVQDGNVTLKGVVGSLSEKRRAIGDAYVLNVKRVDAEKLDVALWARDDSLTGDKYSNLSDDSIRAAIQGGMIYDPRVASTNVTIDIDNGVATLRGVVDSLAAKYAAARIARETVGVLKVKNRLKVRPKTSIKDEVLEERIRNAFARDPYVDADEIGVSVQNGIAALVGSVGTYFEKTQAEDLASRVDGIVAVESRIVVDGFFNPSPYDPYVDDWYADRFLYPYNSPVPSKTDEEIREDIMDELFWSPFTDSDAIGVAVDDGTATLTGTVETWREYDAAIKNAYEGGAVRVTSKMEVK